MININLFGGPGSGKTTTAWELSNYMNKRGYKIEYIPEYAKDLTYGKDWIKLSDQLLVLGIQHHKTFILKDQMDYLIQDSPFIMGIVYAKFKGFLPEKEFTDLTLKLFEKYENINFFLKRNTKHYENLGRTQSLKESISFDTKIKDLLNKYKIPYYEVKVNKNVTKNIFKILKKEFKTKLKNN